MIKLFSTLTAGYAVLLTFFGIYSEEIMKLADVTLKWYILEVPYSLFSMIPAILWLSGIIFYLIALFPMHCDPNPDSPTCIQTDIERLMKYKDFYQTNGDFFFALGVCALIVVLLLTPGAYASIPHDEAIAPSVQFIVANGSENFFERMNVSIKDYMTEKVFLIETKEKSFIINTSEGKIFEFNQDYVKGIQYI